MYNCTTWNAYLCHTQSTITTKIHNVVNYAEGIYCPKLLNRGLVRSLALSVCIIYKARWLNESKCQSRKPTRCPPIRPQKCVRWVRDSCHPITHILKWQIYVYVGMCVCMQFIYVTTYKRYKLNVGDGGCGAIMWYVVSCIEIWGNRCRSYIELLKHSKSSQRDWLDSVFVPYTTTTSKT